ASLDLLRQADCDTGQGFLFAKPMPAAAFAVFVSQWRGATMNASDSTTTSCCVCCKEIPLDAAFTPEGAESSDQREAHSTAFKFAVKHLDEASFRTPFGTEPLQRTTCRSASPLLGENP
ncbi:DUF3330 domain-containing protein, partial [Pseudomonas aeruginosa]|uniref:DUF3330 domain-containing protein n=1 Tax=Pseudomonas aeruginosa TaxID=287 RepID=UPI002E2D2EF3